MAGEFLLLEYRRSYSPAGLIIAYFYRSGQGLPGFAQAIYLAEFLPAWLDMLKSGNDTFKKE